MMQKRFGLLGLFVLIALLSAGCVTDKPAPVAPTVGHTGTVDAVPDAFASAMNPDVTNGVVYYVYMPHGYSGTGDPYPVVYLLHGYGGDENFYPTIFGLVDAIDEMIVIGEMQPMVVVFPNGDNAFGGAFYTDSSHPAVNTSETHILNVVAEVEANYNVSTDPAGKGIAGLSMGGYGAISIAMDNPGVFGFVGVGSAPVSFWGTKTFGDHTDLTYTGIEELLPAVLDQTGYESDPDWDPANPDPGKMAEFQEKFDPALGPPTSMLFAMAAAFSPTDPANPGPTTHAATGVDLPIGLDGEIYLPVWMEWLARDIVYRIVVPDPNINESASLATFELYMTVGLEDDLGLFGGHQVLDTVLAGMGASADVSNYYPGVNDVFGVIPAGHVEQTLPQFRLMLEWFSAGF